ncbi:uncharacterized protein LOC124551103 isoform X2 [Schistocerca americana]|uniref:uncharacterized protein LOC124551103 isoform X2 n=1 Tax=Schistocerca americana TaxID=7009 RepID=UPI001F4F4509|nr:uncharacterized protein LOC124551103 isoform X2 [Schistocerca americana]
MDWHLRTAWCLMVAVWLYSSVGHATGFIWSWNKNMSSDWGSQDTQIYKPVIPKPGIQSGTGSKPADYPQKPPYNRNYFGQPPGTSKLTHEARYPGYQQGYPGYQNYPAGYPRSPGDYGRHGGYPSSSGGSTYDGHQQVYTGSPGFVHYPSNRYSGGGSQWSPPGYTPSYSMIPGLDGIYSARGSRFSTSGTGSKPADYPQKPLYNRNYFGQPPGTSKLTHEARYPGYQQGYPGYRNYPAGYPRSPGDYGRHGGYPSSSGGSTYDGHQQVYTGSPGFVHYPSNRYSGGSSQWGPLGYTPSYSMIPGLDGIYSAKGSRFLTSYHSSQFGLSKNFFRPSFPTVISLSIPHYHYPSSIPPKTTWGCDCYVQHATAVCMYGLKDDLIPPCVGLSVTAVFIQSEEVDWLSVDAFRYVPHLKYINMTDTMLISLPRNLFHYTRDLKHLLVQRNHDLRSLDRDVFQDASKLEDVILDRNGISSLEQDVFIHLKSVQRLNLAYNKIRSLPIGIFRDNRELQELVLSGNPLHFTSDTAKDLMRNNGKLRVLLMRKCKLEDLATGLLGSLSNLEWLDLSHNRISKFPLEFIQNCTKLSYLGLAYNKFRVFSSDMFYQRGGSLATLNLEGNPWHCDCDLLPLASWASLRKDAVPGQPRCSTPHYLEKESLQHWFHSKDVMKCSGATSSLRADLNRVLSVARAIAEQPLSFFANLLPVSDEEVSLTATYYFLYAMAAQTSDDVESVVWHWARFLEKVLDRRHLRYVEMATNIGIDPIGLDRNQLLVSKLVKDDPFNFKVDLSMNPFATTTTKPPTARANEQPLRPKGFEPFVNFTYVLKNVPHNMTKVVDVTIEEELKIVFGIISRTSASSPRVTAANGIPRNSEGFYMTSESANDMAVLPEKLNATEQMVAGLCFELRKMLSVLLQSIDQAELDAAYQKFVNKEEEKATKSPLQPTLTTDPMSTRRVRSSAESCVLTQPRLTVLVVFLTVLAQPLV